MIIEVDSAHNSQKITMNGVMISYLHFRYSSDFDNYVESLTKYGEHTAVVYDGTKTRFYYENTF